MPSGKGPGQPATILTISTEEAREGERRQPAASIDNASAQDEHGSLNAADNDHETEVRGTCLPSIKKIETAAATSPFR